MDKNFYDSFWGVRFDMRRYGPTSRHIQRLCGEIVKTVEFDSIFDAGCGSGLLLQYLRSLKPKVTIAGADFSEVAIESARRILPDATFYVANLEQESLQGRYDLVAAIDVIEHINNDVKFIENIYNITNKYFLIATLIGRMRQHEKEVGHFRNYSQQELVNKLAKAGFETVLIKKWGFPFYSPLYRDLLQIIPKGSNTGEFGLFKKIISELLYLIFCLNWDNKGDYILILSRPKNKNTFF